MIILMHRGTSFNIFVSQEKGLTEMKLSGTKFRKMLRAGEDIPTWFAFESVVKVIFFRFAKFAESQLYLHPLSNAAPEHCESLGIN